MRAAVLDLGTNTFNLLIAEFDELKNLRILYQDEKIVQLAEEGIERIGEKAFQRALKQLKEYLSEIKKYDVEKVLAFGTAAFRKAGNASLLIEQIKSQFGIEVSIISGDEEAELIYLGVRAALPMNADLVLIMDIGGGSTEFIIANKDVIFWKQSFPLGASLLMQKFHHHDPISAEDIKMMEENIVESISPLSEQLKKHPVHSLIGASGSFDSFMEMICFDKENKPDEKHFQTFPFQLLLNTFSGIIQKSYVERLVIPGLVSFRAATITTASILIRTVINLFEIKNVVHSSFALKEGAMIRYLSSNLKFNSSSPVQ